jgi:large subunit ribosomal protein L25
MKTIALKGDLRSSLGTKDAKALRNEGKVPCVLYGGKDVIHFFIYAPDFKNLVYTPNTYKVQLTVDNRQVMAILKDVQFHPVSESILHVDFMEISDGKPVEVFIPLTISGNSPGVRAGGKLIKKMTRLRVRGLINDIPEFYEIKIDDLNIGQSVKVGQVSIKDVEVLDAKQNAIVSVRVTRNVAEEEPTAEAKVAEGEAKPEGEAGKPEAKEGDKE